MVFKKDLMLKRIKEEGLMDQVDDKVMAIMDNLDGQEAITYCWRRNVMGEPVYLVNGKDGKSEYVYEGDCR